MDGIDKVAGVREIAIGRLEDSQSGWTAFQGGDLMPGIVGCAYEQIVTEGETVEEKLRVDIRGTPAETRAVLDRLEALAFQDQHLSGREQPARLYLRIWDDAEHTYWYSRIRAARLEGYKGHWQAVEHGSVSVNFVILRDNYFDGEETALPVGNTGGGGLDGAVVRNHDDNSAGHDNWFSVSTAGLGLNLPAPLRLAITNLDAEPMGDLYAGALQLTGGGAAPKLALEGEICSSAAVITDNGASGGAFGRLTWSGGGWESVGSWSISAEETAQLNGRRCKPIIRFARALPERTVFRILVGRSAGKGVPGGAALAENEVFLADLGSVRFAVIEGTALAGTQVITLQAMAEGSGYHQVDLDDLLLLPTDSFQLYRCSEGLPYGATLNDDGFLGQCWTTQNGQGWVSHIAAGDGLRLRPGSESRFYLLQQGVDGLAAVSRACRVTAWYRPRRRTL